MENETNADDLKLLPLPILLPYVAVVAVVVVVAVTGNTLVLASYARDPKLRTVSNLYLLHLAVCDLLLAAISMPLHLTDIVLKKVWPFGQIVCKVYLVNDYTLCAMSIFIVILVSIDQLLILRQGVFYVTKETKAKAYVKLTIAWLFSFLLYGPAILVWDVWMAQPVLDKTECDVKFRDNKVYIMVTACLEFFLPAVILTSLNLAVYRDIRKRTKVGYQRNYSTAIIKSPVHPKYSHHTCHPVHGEGSRNQTVVAESLLTSPTTEGLYTSQEFCSKDDVQGDTLEELGKAIPVCLNHNVSLNHIDSGASASYDLHREPDTRDQKVLLSRQPQTSALKRRSKFRILKTIGESKDRFMSQLFRHLRKDQKAAQALFVFVFAFVLLWTPYTVTTIIITFCDDCVNLQLYEFFMWWLCLKSAVNPFIYAANNSRFKSNFKDILSKLCVRCSQFAQAKY